jgi:hypothetical protein
MCAASTWNPIPTPKECKPTMVTLSLSLRWRIWTGYLAPSVKHELRSEKG